MRFVSFSDSTNTVKSMICVFSEPDNFKQAMFRVTALLISSEGDFF